jgi:hypothetical protein
VDLRSLIAKKKAFICHDIVKDLKNGWPIDGNLSGEGMTGHNNHKKGGNNSQLIVALYLMGWKELRFRYMLTWQRDNPDELVR